MHYDRNKNGHVRRLHKWLSLWKVASRRKYGKPLLMCMTCLQMIVTPVLIMLK